MFDNIQCIYIFLPLNIRTSSLQVVVAFELCGMGDGGHGNAFFAFGCDESFDELLREDIAHGEVVMILLQSVQSFIQRIWQMPELGFLLFRKVVEVHVVWAPAILVRIDLVLNAIQPGHQERSVAKIRITGRVRVAEFKPAHVWCLGISRDPDHRATVAGGIAYRDRSFKAGNETLERVGGRIRDGAQRGDML